MVNGITSLQKHNIIIKIGILSMENAPSSNRHLSKAKLFAGLGLGYIALLSGT